MESPLVSQASVFGVPDPRWGEQVAAAIIPASGVSLDGKILSNFLLERIARHKVPKHWVFVEELPTNTSGKVQKFVLRDRFQVQLQSADGKKSP
jgi:fatty-acyl-CoA synthase